MAVSFILERVATESQSLRAESLDLGDRGLAYYTGTYRCLRLDYSLERALGICSSKMAPALIMGNTCVIKPPSIDSATTLVLGEILAGLSDIILGGGQYCHRIG